MEIVDSGMLGIQEYKWTIIVLLICVNQGVVYAYAAVRLVRGIPPRGAVSRSAASYYIPISVCPMAGSGFYICACFLQSNWCFFSINSDIKTIKEG